MSTPNSTPTPMLTLTLTHTHLVPHTCVVCVCLCVVSCVCVCVCVCARASVFVCACVWMYSCFFFIHGRLDVSWRMRHMTITSGNDLTRTRVAFVLLYLTLGLLLVSTITILVRTSRKVWWQVRDGIESVLGNGKGKTVHGLSHRDQFLVCSLDLVLIVATWIIASVQLMHVESSAYMVESSIGSM